MLNLEPFQIVFLIFAITWVISQILPICTIQRKIQSTSGLLLVMLGCVLTGIVTIPQFSPEKIQISSYELAKNDDKMPYNGLVNSTPKAKKSQPKSYNNVDDLLNSM